MKILYATMQFGAGYAQGTERYLSILCGGLRRRGHEPLVLAGDPDARRPGAALGQCIADDPPLLHYPARGWMAVEGTPSAELAGVLDEHRPDLVHVANPAHVGLGLVAAARERGIAVVVTVMDYWWVCPKHTLLRPGGTICDGRVSWRECLACIARNRDDSPRRHLARVPLLRSAVLPVLYTAAWRRCGVEPAEIERWKRRRGWIRQTLNQVQAVIFPSRMAETIVGPGVDGPLRRSIPYGLEPHWFAAAAERPRERPTSADRLAIGFAGALEPHKGPHLLLEALHELGWRRTQVSIAGPAPHAAYRRRLEQLAGGLAVRFAGHIAPADMPAFVRSCDLLVVPSLWPENLPIVVLEAYAAGVPVVASDVGGIAEIVPHAALFAPGSPADLAGCLKRWLAAPPAELPRVCSAEEMVAATESLYDEVRAAPAGQGS